MSRTRAFVQTVALVAAAVAASCSGDEARCTEIGCTDGATIKVDLPLSFAQVQKAKISVCRNDTCLAGSFADINAPPSPGAGVGFFVNADPAAGTGADGLVMARATGSLWLQVSWRDSGGSVADGDVYTVTVEDENAVKAVAFRGTATYATLFPNGETCPPSCRRAELDEHTP